MANRIPLVTHEWYHCYNRGVDKRTVFETPQDYERFLAYLYVCNGVNTIQLADRHSVSLSNILNDRSLDRGAPLVEIGAYALMSNHPHLAVRQLQDGGVSRFMQKVFTGYTMYFNLAHNRTGALFAGSFKSKHISTDAYLKRAIAYILMNPAELKAPDWKKGIANKQAVEQFLKEYRYTSLPAFTGRKKGHESYQITNPLTAYYDSSPTMTLLIEEALAYYSDNPSEG